jgi:hypothetical protein
MDMIMIEKEQLDNFRFVKSDVLVHEEEKRDRIQLLKKALWLGNNEQGKVYITFKTIEGEILTVFTTVWAVFENYIHVKANRSIPIQSILKIEI